MEVFTFNVEKKLLKIACWCIPTKKITKTNRKETFKTFLFNVRPLITENIMEVDRKCKTFLRK